tara:strand:+ start:6081 stop:6302 length:222 start_codon:yes stop_codon:yes gene_type:complete
MTIYEIKKRTETTEPYYFSRNTMKFFGQKLKDFKVTKESDGRYKIAAPIRKAFMVDTESVAYFNPTNNKLETE